MSTVGLFSVTVFALSPLPYNNNALEPYISQKTLEFHHGKHHQTYVTNLSNLVKGTKYEKMELSEIMIESAKDSSAVGIFNNAAQHWNHTFYWHSMKENGGGKPSTHLISMMEKDFGGFDKFVDAFKTASASQFGSGWVWLVFDKKAGKLLIVKTGNAENPITNGLIPLMTMDVWEHAYYLDYQNRRADYADIFLKNLVKWEFVEQNLKTASEQ